MKKINEKLSDILDIEPITITEPIKTEVMPVEKTDVVETDTEFARQNIRELLEKGNNAIDELSAVARDSQHPRAYEVLAGMIKNLSEINKDLLEIQKRKQELQPKVTNNNITVDKAVFVGSTAELMKQLKANK